MITHKLTVSSLDFGVGLSANQMTVPLSWFSQKISLFDIVIFEFAGKMILFSVVDFLSFGMIQLEQNVLEINFDFT